MKALSNAETIPAKPITILSLSPDEEDHHSLKCILNDAEASTGSRSKWILLSSRTRESAFALLQEHRISIVLCESRLPPGTWREVQAQIRMSPRPPLLIVTSRFADDRLWCEALNLGAFDVLAKPFDPTEVIRVLSFASSQCSYDGRSECGVWVFGSA
jgi:DNA-binding response OmpR family regulator